MRTLERIDAAQIRELLGREEFFWLDLHSPSHDEIDTLADVLGWHPLAVEDVKEFHQRPKLDDYRDHALLVFYGVHAPDGLLVEVHIFVSGDWVVTVRRAPVTFQLMKVSGRSYYRTLRGKLHWGMPPNYRKE